MAAITRYNVLLIGEGFVGKSTFLHKLADPTAVIQPAAQPEGPFWAEQTPTARASKELTVNGRRIALDFEEIPSSRGRMSNHHEVMRLAAKAHCVLYCFSADADAEWTTRSYNQFKAQVARAKRGSRPMPAQDPRAFLAQQLSQQQAQQQQVFQQQQEQLRQQYEAHYQQQFQQQRHLLVNESQVQQFRQYYLQLCTQDLQRLQQQQAQQQQALKAQHDQIIRQAQMKFLQQQQNVVPNDDSDLPAMILLQLKTDKNPNAVHGDRLAQETGKQLVKVSSPFNYNMDACVSLVASSLLEEKLEKPTPAMPHALLQQPQTPTKKKVSDIPLVA